MKTNASYGSALIVFEFTVANSTIRVQAWSQSMLILIILLCEEWSQAVVFF